MKHTSFPKVKTEKQPKTYTTMTPQLENSLDDETRERKDEPRAFVPREQVDELKQEIANLKAVGSLLLDSDDDAKMANHLYQLRLELEEYKQALRELIPIAGFYHDQTITYSEMPYKHWSAIIDKARKLL